MRYSHLAMMVISVLVGMVICSNAFADSGFSCGPSDINEPYREYLKPPCYHDTWNLSSRDNCENFCKASTYCELYEDSQRTVLSGFWRESSTWHDDIRAECTESCMADKALCDANDTECLQMYIPKDTDCSQFANSEDQEYCEANCVNHILTSECGRICLESRGCINDSHNNYCSNLCTESYCASIPLDYQTRWNVFGVLMTLLAAMSCIILIVMHRNNKKQDSES